MNKKYITLTLILLSATQTYTMDDIIDTQCCEALWILSNYDPNIKSCNNKQTTPKSLPKSFRAAAEIYLGPKAEEYTNLIPKQKKTVKAKKTKQSKTKPTASKNIKSQSKGRKTKEIDKTQYTCNVAFCPHESYSITFLNLLNKQK